MKTFAIFMMVVTLILAGTMGWELMNTNLKIAGVRVDYIQAQQKHNEFVTLINSAETGSLSGTVFPGAVFHDEEDSCFYVYTLRLKNNGLVPAEMVEVQIAPVSGDVLCYDSAGMISISPGETKDVQCVLLTKYQTVPVRELVVTYYLWGNPQTVKFTYEPD